MTQSAHTAAMQAPTERNPDYRRQEFRDAEVIAQIDIDGGLTRAWIDADRYRPCAVDRLMRAGRVRLRLPAIEGNGVLRYEVVKPAKPSLLSRLNAWLGGAS